MLTMRTEGLQTDEEEENLKRRELVRSLAVAAAFIPVHTQARPACLPSCRSQTDELAASMKEMFGGDWSVTVQPDFVLISRDLSSRSFP